MSDPFRINSIFNRLKSQFIRDGYGSGAGYSPVSKKEQHNKEEFQERQECFLPNPENEKLFKLGEILGLSKNEVIEALEILVLATSKIPPSQDVASCVLNNDLIKFPMVDDFSSDISDKALYQIEKDYPELFLAITNPFDFMNKFPQTVSIEKYKKFSYSEMLEFSRINPVESDKLSEIIRKERDNGLT